MGTDYMAFLAEGVRVLRPGGRLLVAEIRSRFEGAPAAATTTAAAAGGGAEGGGGASGTAGRKRAREEGSGGEASPSGLQAFLASVAALGCTLDKVDEGNKMFVFLSFTKASTTGAGGGGGGGEKKNKHLKQSAKHGGGGGPQAGASKKEGGKEGWHDKCQIAEAAALNPAAGPSLRPCLYKKR